MLIEQENPMNRIIKPLPRGQITIPIEFRKKLGIDEDTFLNLALKGNKIEITPVTIRESSDEDLRNYTNEEIAEFLSEDKIDQKTADIVRELLTEGKL
jgi:AbrB family looped-hinge helix DNA binding protein